jgi:hypothetical protein
MKGNHLIIKLFILLMLAPQLGFTQYKSFFGTEEVWAVREFISMSEYPPDVDYTYSFGRDTLSWQGNTYQKIVHTFKKTGDTMYVLYAREELASGKMYLYDSTVGTEFLFIDMSLDLGDTFKTNIHHNDPIYVDSVFFEQGLKHLRLRSSNGENYMEWVEGVGANYSFYRYPNNTNSTQLALVEFTLYCYFKDGRHFYTNHSITDRMNCNAYLSSDDIKKLPYNVLIHPNPATDRIIVEGIPSVEQATLKIYDMLGRLLVNNELLSNAHSTAHLPAGMYVAVVQNVQGELLYRTQLSVER